MTEWGDVAADWRELWGSFAEPVQKQIITDARITEGTRVLDVGCGTGEFLALLSEVGAIPTGIDPAEGMVQLAQEHVAGGQGSAVVGEAEHLPFADASFDVVTAVNAFQFADDPIDALAEFTRVLVPGGLVVIANWADAAENDIDTIEKALDDDDDDGSESKLRLPGGQQELLEAFGLDVVFSGLVEAPWHAPDDDILVRGVLLGEDPETQQQLADIVREAAASYRTTTGGYLLKNAFRYAVAKTSS